MMETKNTKGVPGQNKSLRKWVSRVFFILLGLGIIMGVVSAWQPKPVAVETARAVSGRLVVTVDEDGRTRVKDRHIISAPLAGDLARVELHPGDRVNTETVLARLLPLPAPLLDVRSLAEGKARQAAMVAALNQAKAAYSRSLAAMEYAQKEAEKYRTLVRKNSIPVQQLEQAELELKSRKEEYASAGFGVKVAEHEVQLAKAAMGRLDSKNENNDQMQIFSPIEGVVLEVIRQNEGVVAAGTPLIEIGNPEALEVVVQVLTTDAVRVKEGAGVEMVRWGGDEALSGHVRRVEPKAFTRLSSLGVEEQRVNLVLDLDSPFEKWSSLGDGFRVEASISVWEKNDAVKVPVGALFKHSEKWSVFVVKNNVAGMRHVEIGQQNGIDVQILKGVSIGETVVLHPGERISEGTIVQVR